MAKKITNKVYKSFFGSSNHNESLTFALYNPGGAAGDAFDLAVQETCRCADRDAAKARVIQNVPVWQYHLALTRPENSTSTVHTSDIHYVFNTPRQPIEDRLAIPDVPGLNMVIQDAWGTFARDPANGFTSYGWPKYDASSE
jgi:carboxylesterase type B